MVICILALLDIGIFLRLEEQGRIDYRFEIVFTPEEEGHQSIIIPFPTHGDSKRNVITKKFDDIDFKYRIESTPYGLGLNVSSDGTIKLKIRGTIDFRDPSYRLTLENDTTVNTGIKSYWIHSVGNGTFRYLFTVENWGFKDVYSANATLERGWQQVDFGVGGWVV